MAGLIGKLRERRWTAITQHVNGVCANPNPSIAPRTAAGGEFALPEEAALRDGGSAGVRQSQNLSGLGALSAQAVQLRAGPGEPALGVRHLPLDGAEVAVGARRCGLAQQSEAVGAGLDIAEMLAQIVDQVDEDGFRR